MIQTYQTLDRESAAYNCLRLIERCAPKFLKMGGGGVAQEQLRAHKQNRTPPEVKAKVIQIARTGKYDSAMVGQMAGVTQSVAWKIIRKAGVEIPDGRTLRRIIAHE